MDEVTDFLYKYVINNNPYINEELKFYLSKSIRRMIWCSKNFCFFP